MIVDLVQTMTRDGVKLHGALHRAASTAAGKEQNSSGNSAAGRPSTIDAPGGLDVLLCLPGVGGNFYGTTMAAELTPLLTAAGLDVLWINTRGHDSIAVVHTRRGGMRQGAAFETVDDCRHDVTAWLDFLLDRGYRAPGLFGHSLGAIKALYSQAFAPHPEARLIVAVSPPRLSCRAFRAGEDHSRYEEDLATAQQHVASGRPQQLIETRFPVPLIISAGSYVDKYGPEERYNILRFVPQVGCPHAFIYGGQELAAGNIAFTGVPEAIEALPRRRFPAPVFTVPDADHMYTGKWDALARVILHWLGDPRGGS